VSTIPAWLESFSPAWRDAIAAELQPSGARRVACFDADGTLWSEDIGEAFLRWMLAGRLIATSDHGADVWEEYEHRVARDRSAAYAWAVALMAGGDEAQIAQWSAQLAAAWPNYRAPMKALARGLHEAGFEIWIVSASNRWTVRAAAPIMGFDPARVLAIHTEVDGGRITNRIVEPVTCEGGKVSAIAKWIGVRPIFAVGDSLGDLQMLEDADVPLVVGRHDMPRAALLGVARQRDWPVHLF